MASLPEQIAQALLAKALAVTATGGDGRSIVVKGGRSGEGGPIPETPFVEIGDAGWDVQVQSASVGALDYIRARYAVVFYRIYGREVDREKEDLRELFWAFRSALLADPTLGGIVTYAHVVEARTGLIPREGKHYWFWIAEVEVHVEA